VDRASRPEVNPGHYSAWGYDYHGAHDQLSHTCIDTESGVAPESHHHLYAASSLCVWPHTQPNDMHPTHIMRGAPARSLASYSAPPYWWTMRAGPTTNSVAQSHGACHGLVENARLSRAGPCSPQHGSCVAPYTRSCPVSGGAGSALGTVEPPLVDHASWSARAVWCEQPAAWACNTGSAAVGSRAGP
jgi:hypothetical protein